nr:MAG TPA: hypothetical protein [Caudoviricetes sp.]
MKPVKHKSLVIIKPELVRAHFIFYAGKQPFYFFERSASIAASMAPITDR